MFVLKTKYDKEVRLHEEEVHLLRLVIDVFARKNIELENRNAVLEQQVELLQSKYLGSLKEIQKWKETAHTLDSLRKDALGYD